MLKSLAGSLIVNLQFAWIIASVLAMFSSEMWEDTHSYHLQQILCHHRSIATTLTPSSWLLWHLHKLLQALLVFPQQVFPVRNQISCSSIAPSPHLPFCMAKAADTCLCNWLCVLPPSGVGHIVKVRLQTRVRYKCMHVCITSFISWPPGTFTVLFDHTFYVFTLGIPIKLSGINLVNTVKKDALCILFLDHV